MSRTLASALAGVVAGATVWMKPYRRAMTRALVSERLVQSVTVATAGGPIRFLTPSGRALHDPWALYQNEPETIRWLDSLPSDEVLWDIGANIGVYALYAAKVRGMRVLAFEPSAASYAVLVRNIEINGLGDRIDAYCLAFDATSRLDYLHMAATEAGHSMHSFGTSQTAQGVIAPKFRQSVPGFAIDGFRALFRPPPPGHIKLDVDGNEAAVLRGAAATLATTVKTVLVEIETEEIGRDIRGSLAPLGYVEDIAFAAQGVRRNVLFRREPRATPE
jgi:FkbM family methyltransferase